MLSSGSHLMLLISHVSCGSQYILFLGMWLVELFRACFQRKNERARAHDLRSC
jgi:hypothetical protein